MVNKVLCVKVAEISVLVVALKDSLKSKPWYDY